MSRPSLPIPAQAGLRWQRRHWLLAFPAAGLAAWRGAGASPAAAGAAAPPAAAAAPEAAAPAPIAWPELQTVQGQLLSPAHWAGVPAVVVFWATWCGYCRRHNAHIDRLHRSVDPARLRVLGVATDRSAALVRRYLQQTGYGFPTVADGGALRERFTTRRVIPMTCVLGADGRLQAAWPGEMAEADVMALAQRALPAR